MTDNVKEENKYRESSKKKKKVNKSLQQTQCVPVWLKGDLVISCDLTKILFQLLKQLLITFCLVQRHKWVNVSKLPPGDWLSMRAKKTKQSVFMNELAQ